MFGTLLEKGFTPMAQDLDRRMDTPDNDRRLVKRFSDPELRKTAGQIQSLLKVMMLVLSVVIVDQGYLASRDKTYITHAVFYGVVALMLLIQTGSYHLSLTAYGQGESATSMVHSFHSQRNFFAMAAFMLVIFTLISVIAQLP